MQTGIVTKYKNIPVFVMSEPVKEYNVVGAVTNKFRADTVQLKNGTITINDLVNSLVAYAEDIRGKENIDFDAIITTDGLSGSLIKFKPGKSITDSVKVKP